MALSICTKNPPSADGYGTTSRPAAVALLFPNGSFAHQHPASLVASEPGCVDGSSVKKSLLHSMRQGGGGEGAGGARGQCSVACGRSTKWLNAASTVRSGIAVRACQIASRSDKSASAGGRASGFGAGGWSRWHSTAVTSRSARWDIRTRRWSGPHPDRCKGESHRCPKSSTAGCRYRVAPCCPRSPLELGQRCQRRGFRAQYAVRQGNGAVAPGHGRVFFGCAQTAFGAAEEVDWATGGHGG